MRQLAAVVLVCACLALVGCGTAVPNTEGMTLGQATKAVEAAGFQVGAVTYDESSTDTTGSAVAQVPKAGTRAKAGASVALTIAGPPPVTTPDLSGLDKEKAQAALTAVGLTLGGVTESYDASVSAGLLVSQKPPASAETFRGSAVSCVISKGPKPVAIPSITGKSEDEAKRLLKAAGFNVASTSAYDKAKKGTVFAQQPAGGKTAGPGTTVSVRVSKGPEPVTVGIDGYNRASIKSWSPKGDVSGSSTTKVTIYFVDNDTGADFTATFVGDEETTYEVSHNPTDLFSGYGRVSRNGFFGSVAAGATPNISHNVEWSWRTDAKGAKYRYLKRLRASFSNAG